MVRTADPKNARITYDNCMIAACSGNHTMAPISFSVTQVRVAATCPRIAYFDADHTRRRGLVAPAVTRIWKAGDNETACGSLFHHAIGAFNRKALSAPEVRDALRDRPNSQTVEQKLRAFLNRHCVNLAVLSSKPAAQQLAFTETVGVYMKELADIVAYALSTGKPADEILMQLFGDSRRNVDVTFTVGPHGEKVRVKGILDYVFYDWRTTHHRIIDYKLTPAGEPAGDLFQVGLYALMHNIQHQTESDVGVLYLYPHRTMLELTWDQVNGHRAKVFNLLASMAEWVKYDEQSGYGLKPPGRPANCSLCKWNKKDACAQRLGPKDQGLYASQAAGLLNKVEAAPAAAVASEPARPWADEVEPEFELDEIDAPPPAPSSPAPPSAVSPASAGVLFLGTTTTSSMPVGLPLAALPTHVAVVGAAGSGKTWMAKVVAEEAVRLGVPVLAVDPQGDLVQFLRRAPEPPALSAAEKRLRDEFVDRVEPRVWTPGSSHGRRLCLDPIRLAARDELARVADPARRREEWEGMLAAAAGQLVALAKMGGETDSQQTFLFRVLQSLADGGKGRDVGLAEIAAAAAEPARAGIADPDPLIKKSEREKIARKLTGLSVGPSAHLYTGGQRLDLDAMCRPDTPGKTPLNVIYLNALADDDAKHLFLASLAGEIYRWMITSLEPTPGRPSLLFYLDEARDYIPAGASKPPAKSALIRLFTQGRKYGVACLLCTQSPRSVDYNVFGNCSTKLIGRLESQQDLNRVEEWFSKDGAVPPWISARKGADAGSFIGRWPDMPPSLEGHAIRSRPLASLHEGAWSPDRLERELGDA